MELNSSGLPPLSRAQEVALLTENDIYLPSGHRVGAARQGQHTDLPLAPEGHCRHPHAGTPFLGFRTPTGLGAMPLHRLARNNLSYIWVKKDFELGELGDYLEDP